MIDLKLLRQICRVGGGHRMNSEERYLSDFKICYGSLTCFNPSKFRMLSLRYMKTVTYLVIKREGFWHERSILNAAKSKFVRV